jgi:hypothetical protein
LLIRKEEKMRLVHAAAVSVAVLLLASAASAQGLGDAATREKEKRKAAPAKPAKVYTDTDIGRSMAPVSATELPVAPPEGGAAAAKPEGAQGAAGEAAPSDAEKAAEDARLKAEADWRKRLDQARKEEAVYRDIIDKLQLELNDTSGGFYNPGRASKIAFQDENKQKLAEVQGRIAALEDEGRRSGYR